MPPKKVPEFVPHPFSTEPVALTRVETPYKDYGELRRYILRHETFAGTQSAEISRECYVTGNAVVVLPYDPATDAVLLIEQFRIGPYAQGRHPWILECIAGRFNPGEEPAAVAEREALEEAGARLTDLTPMGAFFQSPGIFYEEIAYFTGRFEAKSISGLHGLDEEDEDIRPVVIARQEALDMVRTNKIVSAPTALALYWLEAHRDQVFPKSAS